jgi:hypothetical protein
MPLGQPTHGTIQAPIDSDFEISQELINKKSRKRL